MANELIAIVVCCIVGLIGFVFGSSYESYKGRAIRERDHYQQIAACLIQQLKDLGVSQKEITELLSRDKRHDDIALRKRRTNTGNC